MVWDEDLGEIWQHAAVYSDERKERMMSGEWRRREEARDGLEGASADLAIVMDFAHGIASR